MNGALISLRRGLWELWSGPEEDPIPCAHGLSTPSFSPPPSSDRTCPIGCWIKASVILGLAMFILYFPLGDPYKHCSDVERMMSTNQFAMCCLCDIYLVSTKAISKCIEIAEMIYKTIGVFLYEAKLKFYSLLGKLDKDDLCRIICCPESSSSLVDGEKTQRRYKCSRKCNKLKNNNI